MRKSGKNIIPLGYLRELKTLISVFKLLCLTKYKMFNGY